MFWRSWYKETMRLYGMRNDEVSFKNKIEIISFPRSVTAIGVVVAQIFPLPDYEQHAETGVGSCICICISDIFFIKHIQKNILCI